MKPNIAHAIVAALGLVPIFAEMSAAEPMRCSTEKDACVVGCGKFGDQKMWRACVTACSQRQAACQRTGCWDNGARTYCGLLRR